MDLRSYTQSPINMEDFQNNPSHNNSSTQFFSSNYSSSRIAPPYSPAISVTSAYTASPFGNNSAATNANNSFNKAVQAPARFLPPQVPGTPSKSTSSLSSPSFNVNNTWMESQHTGNSTTSDYNPTNTNTNNGSSSNYNGILNGLKNDAGIHDQFESLDKKLHSNNTGNSSNILNDNIVNSLSGIAPPPNHSLLDTNFSSNNHSVSSLNGKKEDAKNNDEEVIPTAIVIKNIPFSIKKEQLLEEMIKMNLPLPYAFNYHFDNGVFRGLAFANFTSHEETAMVVNNLHYKEISGRKLRVEYKKMLPLMERERIEREKREKRGQLEEQHKSASTLSLALNKNNNNNNNNSSVNQFTLHDLSSDNNNNKRFYASFPSTNITLPPQLDFNNSEVLDLYSTLLLFKYDASSNRSEEIVYPLTISNIHKKHLTLICLFLDLQESFENNLIVVKRWVANQPHFTIQPPLMNTNSRNANMGNSSPLPPPSANSANGQSFLNMSPVMPMHMSSPTIVSMSKNNTSSSNNNRTYNNNNNNNNTGNNSIASPIPPPSFSSSYGNFYGNGNNNPGTGNSNTNSPQIASPTTYMMSSGANSTSALSQQSAPNGAVSSSAIGNSNNLLNAFNPPSTSFHHPHHNLHNHTFNNNTNGSGLYSSLNNSNPNFGSSVGSIGSNNGNGNVMMVNLTQNLTGGDTFTPTTTSVSSSTPTTAINNVAGNGNGSSGSATAGSGGNGSPVAKNGLLGGLGKSMGNLNLSLHHGNGSNISVTASNGGSGSNSSNTRNIWGSGRFM